MLLKISTAQILKTLLFLIASFIVFLVVSKHFVFASSFSVDSTFGNNGQVITTFGNRALADSVAATSDNKIIVGGFASNGSYNTWKLEKYNFDGTIDTSFGTGGIVTQDFGFDQVINSFKIDKDGKIVVGASDPAGNGPRIWTIARYTHEGSLDSSFNGGLIANPLGDDVFEILTDLVIRPDGKIVAEGYRKKSNGNSEDVILALYNPDGSIDSNFGVKGIISTNFGPEFERGHKVALSDNGKIVVLGDYNSGGIFLLRYNPDGSLDTSFGTGGVVKDQIGSSAYGIALAIQPDGKIVVIGGVNGPNDVYAIRYNTDGTRDASFGTDGLFTQSFSPQDDLARAIVLQPNGKIILAGNEYDETVGHNLATLWRLNTDGTLDNTFGDNGSLSTSTDADSVFYSLAMQPDGKLLAAGTSGQDWIVARYIDTSSVPTSTPTEIPTPTFTPTPASTPTPTPINLAVPLIKQTDSKWGSQTYDSANIWSPLHKTISDFGCALTSAVMILKYYGINVIPNNSALGIPLTPGTLNNWLKNEPDGYIGDGLVNWISISRLSKLAKIANGITSFDALEYTRFGGDINKLANDISQNTPDIIEEPGHFIVGKGVDNNIITINDPYFPRTTLSDYGNTLISLGQYKPSLTDLSYIMLTVDPNIQIEVKDKNGVIVGNQFIQQPLADDMYGGIKGIPIKIVYVPKPSNTDYDVIISGVPQNTYALNNYLYDTNGNVKKIEQEGIIDSGTNTIHISFNKNKLNQSNVSRIVTFQTMIEDIIALKTKGLITKKYADNLIRQLNDIQNDIKRNRKIIAKIKLEIMKILFRERLGWKFDRTAFDILRDDITYLLKSI